jgi:glyoxylase-like metal-dependent hydrolase (beta-lactamase superfamily II)
MKLDEGLYAYLWTDPNANNSNSYLIRSDSTVLIDPGHLQFLERLVQALRLDGIHEDSIGGIICTHLHPDHLEGVAAFSHRGVWAALGLKDEAFMRQASPDLAQACGMNPSGLKIEVLLKEGELLLGKERFEVLETPGHSPGSICIWWPRKRALFTGDVVFEMGVGRTDLPGGDGKALIGSIEKLSRLEADILLPGHGNIVVGRERIQRNFQLIKETYYPLL